MRDKHHWSHPFLHEVECTRDTFICILSISLIGIVTLIVVPFSIYCTYKFYYYRRDQGIVLRYPTTLTVSSILNIFYMLIVVQYMIIDAGISHRISLWIAPIVSNPYLILIILINIFRIWLINYDINYKIIQTRSTWQSLLCSTVIDDEWYATNRYTWGNWRWLYKILLFIWLFLSVLCITPLFLNQYLGLDIYEKTADIIYSSSVILSLLFAVAIWIRMPQFEDTFLILKEIKILMTSSVILCIIWFSLIFWSEHGNIFNIIQILIIFLFVFIQILVSEYLVMRMIRKINANEGRNTHDSTLILHNKTLFRIIVSTDIGIEQYFQHVQKEFSHENLLFFIEVMQWLYTVTDQQWTDHDIGPLTPQSLQYAFAKVIPMSSINSDASADWFDRFQQLYNKYICESAMFQINLPDHHRQEYSRVIHLYQMKKDIASGTFEPKWIKKKNTQREPSVLSTSKSIKQRLFTLRRNRNTQRKALAPRIDEEKASLDTEHAPHVRYSKSMQAYGTKTKLNKTLVTRQDTAPPARRSTALRNAKSADQAQDTRSEVTTREATMIENFDSGSSGNISSKPPQSQATETSPGRYSMTITNMDENERKSIVLIHAITDVDVPAAKPDVRRVKGRETMDLEDIYMGVINSEDTPPEGDEPEQPIVPAMKSVSFANVDSDRTDKEDTEYVTHRDAADAGTDTENMDNDQTVRIHRGNEPTLVSIVSTVPSTTDSEHRTIEEDIESRAEMVDKNVSFETDVNSTRSMQLELAKEHQLRKLSEIKEEEKRASPILNKKESNSKKLDAFIDEVNLHIDAAKNPNKNEAFTEGFAALSFDKMASRATTMTTNEFEYSVRRNLSSRRRNRGSGMSQMLGKAWTAIFTPRTMTSQHVSTFMEEDETHNTQFVIDPVVQREMEMAKTVDINQFVTVSCFAVDQVLSLSRQSVSRFKSSKYFQAFDDNVNLEQLIKEFER